MCTMKGGYCRAKECKVTMAATLVQGGAEEECCVCCDRAGVVNNGMVVDGNPTQP